jgi:hypothetical protein
VLFARTRAESALANARHDRLLVPARTARRSRTDLAGHHRRPQQAADPAATTHAQLPFAAAICSQGRHAEAGPIVDQCIREFTRLGDSEALAAALLASRVRMEPGRFATAQTFAERAIHLARVVGDKHGESLALRMLALALGNLPGHGTEAVTSAEQALTLARELGEPLEYEFLHMACARAAPPGVGRAIRVAAGEPPGVGARHVTWWWGRRCGRNVDVAGDSRALPRQRCAHVGAFLPYGAG